MPYDGSPVRPSLRGTIATAGTDSSTDREELAPPAPDWALPPRRRRGYDSDLVEDLFERATQSYEAVRRQRDRLSSQLDALRREVTQLRDEQPLVQSALVSAHQTAREVVAQAEAEAEAIREGAQEQARDVVDNARKRAQDIVSEAEDDRARIEQQAAQMRSAATALRAEYVELIGKAAALLDDNEGSSEPVSEIKDSLRLAATPAPEA